MTDGLPGLMESAEIAQLREELEGLNGELVRLNGKYARLLKERDADARAARTAAQARAWHMIVHAYRTHLISVAREPFNELCWATMMLSQQPTAEQVEGLKAAGRRASEVVAEHQDPQTVGLLAEVERLRNAVQAQASHLHDRFGSSSGRRCDCHGCELVRTLDDVSQGEATDA